MTDWRSFLAIAGRHLRENNRWTFAEWSDTGRVPQRRTWCSWTTFDRLERDAGYWTAELLLETELGEKWTTDGGTWDQPFDYGSLAHLIIPRTFCEELALGPDGFFLWVHHQEVDGLSAQLDAAGITHRISSHALDIKLF